MNFLSREGQETWKALLALNNSLMTAQQKQWGNKTNLTWRAQIIGEGGNMGQRKGGIYARDSSEAHSFPWNALLKGFELALSQVPRMILTQLNKHEMRNAPYYVTSLKKKKKSLFYHNSIVPICETVTKQRSLKLDSITNIVLKWKIEGLKWETD